MPESTQAHTYKGEYYDRNRDGDFILRSTEQIANLFIRKSKLKTEDRVYPVFTLKDLDPEALDYMRLMVKSDNPDHEWLKMDNESILRSGQMIKVDPETGKEGITLVAILLFGKRNTIANVFSQMGIVEELGSGTKKMFKYTPLFSGGKDPIIEEQDVYRITIPCEDLSVETAEFKEKTTEKILRLIEANPLITTNELAEACGLTSDGVFYQTKKLRKSGIIKREGGRKEGRWVVLK